MLNPVRRFLAPTAAVAAAACRCPRAAHPTPRRDPSSADPGRLDPTLGLDSSLVPALRPPLLRRLEVVRSDAAPELPVHSSTAAARQGGTPGARRVRGVAVAAVAKSVLGIQTLMPSHRGATAGEAVVPAAAAVVRFSWNGGGVL